jgi:hypothetical protein
VITNGPLYVVEVRRPHGGVGYVLPEGGFQSDLGWSFSRSDARTWRTRRAAERWLRTQTHAWLESAAVAPLETEVRTWTS